MFIELLTIGLICFYKPLLLGSLDLKDDFRSGWPKRQLLNNKSSSQDLGKSGVTTSLIRRSDSTSVVTKIKSFRIFCFSRHTIIVLGIGFHSSRKLRQKTPWFHQIMLIYIKKNTRIRVYPGVYFTLQTITQTRCAIFAWVCSRSLSNLVELDWLFVKFTNHIPGMVW